MDTFGGNRLPKSNQSERINVIWANSKFAATAQPAPPDHDRHAYMSEPVYEIRIALGSGTPRWSFSCDLTAEYVRINADYNVAFRSRAQRENL
jgi:N-acetylglutamate synthase/N-acetylornithine aminotransferase